MNVFHSFAVIIQIYYTPKHYFYMKRLSGSDKVDQSDNYAFRDKFRIRNNKRFAITIVCLNF